MELLTIALLIIILIVVSYKLNRISENIDYLDEKILLLLKKDKENEKGFSKTEIFEPKKVVEIVEEVKPEEYYTKYQPQLDEEQPKLSFVVEEIIEEEAIVEEKPETIVAEQIIVSEEPEKLEEIISVSK